MQRQLAEKKITDFDGVYASAIHCGLKPKRKDLGYMYVPDAHACAAVFTLNHFAAPCIHFNRKNLKRNAIKAVVVNSGNANAGTGEQGAAAVKTTARIAAKHLGLKPAEILVASTGIIGVQLPMDKISEGLDTLLETKGKKDSAEFTEAILTTDTCTKEVYVEEKIGKKTIAIAGVAKGSGMIAPNMATMLAFMVTNAKVPQSDLQRFFQHSVEESFNMTSVDTDTSTNDMAVLFSTGPYQFNLKSKEEREAFQRLLDKACKHLAKLIAADGEGAKKLIEVQVQNAASKQDARKIALNVVNSPLVKTAIHGADPNWGRILAAAGKDPSLKFNTKKVDISLSGIPIMKSGEVVPFAKEELVEALKQPEIIIHLTLNLGKFEATAWGCELTKGYVNINTKYN